MPLLAPVVAVERPETLLDFAVETDGLEAFDDKLLQALVVGTLGEANFKRHSRGLLWRDAVSGDCNAFSGDG
jgi:hypothetical protein